MVVLECTFLSLTLYHTIQIFHDPEEEVFWGHCGRGRKSAFSSSPTVFSTLSKSDFNIWVGLVLSSANALYLDGSRILAFGKDLNLCNEFILDKLMLVMSRHKPGPLLWARSSDLCFVGWGVY